MLGWHRVALLTLALAFAARPARAEAPSPELMTRLATYAHDFDAMSKTASYAVSGRMETLDGDGKADSLKVLTARVESDGKDLKLVVVKYVEDGEDKTAEAKKDARERAEKKKPGKKKELRMPLAETEQARYVFDQVEVDKADPARVRITFTPKVSEENTIEGSAWIDTRTATVISAGFKLSQPPLFVDFVHFTVEFGAPTSPVPAISRVVVDGKGGILFFRKHFRATASLSDYRMVHVP